MDKYIIEFSRVNTNKKDDDDYVNTKSYNNEDEPVESLNYSNSNMISRPLKDQIGLLIQVDNQSVIIGYENKESLDIKDGEVVIFSKEKEDDDEYKAYIHIKADGKIEIKGEEIEFTDEVKIISDKVTFSKDVKIEGDVKVDGDIECKGDVKVDGDIECKGDVKVDGNIECKGDIEAKGDIKTSQISSLNTFYNEAKNHQHKGTGNMGAPVMTDATLPPIT